MWTNKRRIQRAFEKVEKDINLLKSQNREIIAQLNHTRNANVWISSIQKKQESNGPSKKKVIILSAGKGERLRPYTENSPKSLLELANGKTILETQLKSIEEANCIDEVIIVAGYRIEQVLAKLKGYNKIPIRVLHNPFYEVSNNLMTLWIAKEYLEDYFIIVNGDDVFKPKLLKDLVEKQK